MLSRKVIVHRYHKDIYTCTPYCATRFFSLQILSIFLPSPVCFGLAPSLKLCLWYINTQVSTWNSKFTTFEIAINVKSLYHVSPNVWRVNAVCLSWFSYRTVRCLDENATFYYPRIYRQEAIYADVWHAEAIVYLDKILVCKQSVSLVVK